MTIELRTLSVDDWPVWRSVRLAALTDAPDAFGSRLHEWSDAPDDRWRDRLSIPGAIDLLAVNVDGTVPVGMATGIPSKDQPSRAELISMWVDPAVRGRGVATALIAAIAHWAATTGAATLALSVMVDNYAARRNYEKNGFTVSDEPGDLLPGAQCKLVMLRDLGQERTESDPHRPPHETGPFRKLQAGAYGNLERHRASMIRGNQVTRPVSQMSTSTEANERTGSPS